ncbi:MAG: cysteine desulfurase family protein [Thermoanaerobaculia bacterium]
MTEPVYLDHHATTPCDPRVLEKMLPFFTETFGNPAAVTSPHGRRAATAVEDARAAVADFLRVRPAEVVFTAGATESNNMAIRGLAAPGSHVVTSAVEHKSVLEPLARLARAGVEVTILPVDGEGFVDPERVRDAIRPSTVLVSVMAANGEIGTIEPVAAIGAICRDAGVRFHTDATQAVGKIPVDLSEIPCDLLSLSAHKIYGPKGIGALVIRRGVRLEPLVIGGGQEKGWRSGTVNVPGTIGLAAALELRRAEMEEEAVRLAALRDHLRERIVREITDTRIHGPRELRLPGNLNVSFRGIDAESLMFALRRFSVSSGSACSAGEREPSHVLRAIGADDAAALGSIRFGLGKTTSRTEIDRLADDLVATVGRLRQMSVH